MDAKLERKQILARTLAANNDGRLAASTLKMFLRVLVQYLRDHGAASTAELRGRLEFQYIELRDDDLTHVVERARRHRLIEPLGHPHTADGSAITACEWHPTEAGLKLAPPLSESDANNDIARFRDWFVTPFLRTVKPVGVATAVGVAGGALKLDADDLARAGVGIFFLLEFLVIGLNPLRTRLLDWWTLLGWPYYATTLEASWNQYRALRARRRLRRLRHGDRIGYWSFVRRRADLINASHRGPEAPDPEEEPAAHADDGDDGDVVADAEQPGAAVAAVSRETPGRELVAPARTAPTERA